MNGAKSAQEKHWARIAEGKFDENYYRSVRRIGAVHARIGLEPRWYVGGYAMVLEDLLRGVNRHCAFWRRALNLFRTPHAGEASVAIVKAALLDMELSLSIYFEEAQAERNAAISALDGALAALAGGDLSTELRDLPPSFAALEQSYNDTLAKVGDMIGAVGATTTAIGKSASEIAQAADDLARRTEANASSLEQTSASITQMDQRLKATAEAADGTVRRADGAIAVVDSGRALAHEAVAAMGRVSESAQGIDGVIEGLDKIAFQTRVLAMNAAVEAGRAGEAGRGFAVVADLVSALAMRAEEEAKRARDQLTVTQSEVVTAVEAVRKVDGALENISSDVGEVHVLVGRIAADNLAQASAITQINAAIGAMDHATQQNAAMVEETSAASRNLKAEIGTLDDRVAQFRTDPRNAKPAARRHFVPEHASVQ